MLHDFSCPADVGVGGDMPVMSMVDKTYMYIRSLKRETQQVLPDGYGEQEKPMPVLMLTCGKFAVVRRGMICFGLWPVIWALFGTKVTWVWWCGFNFRKPSCKDKNNDYYPVINTHITDNKAAHECPRYSEDGAKDVGQIQDRLSNILGPGKSSALGTLPTQPLTATAIKLIIDHIKYIFIVLVLPTKSVVTH